MIQYYDKNGNLCPLTDYEDFYITHKLDGCDEMSFTLNTKHPQYQELYEECRINAGGNEWLIKKIDDDVFNCELNFDFLKTSGVYIGYKSETQTLRQVLESILTDWELDNVNISSIRRTIEFDYCTDYDIIYECMNTYDVYFVWNIPEKILYIYSDDYGISAGEYVTSELNLKTLSFNGDSSDFATRLYAFGAEGMTLEDAEVDGKRYGKTYVENNDYSDKTICAYWSDERYTVVDNLYEDAVEKLKELSFPVRSYECDVVDLAKMSDKYSFLDFGMHKSVTLIDIERNIKVEHHIVEYKEYPDEPTRNKIILSAVPDTIQSVVNRVSNDADVMYQEVYDKYTVDIQAAIDNATALITGHAGGYVVLNPSENPEEILILGDEPDYTKAKKVWRWNSGGLGYSNQGYNGPFETAITMDGQIICKFLAAGTLEGFTVMGSEIIGGTINIGDGVFTVDKSGAVAITSGNINIGNGAFTVNSSGAVAVTSGSLDINGGTFYIHSDGSAKMSTGYIGCFTLDSTSLYGAGVKIESNGITLTSSSGVLQCSDMLDSSNDYLYKLNSQGLSFYDKNSESVYLRYYTSSSSTIPTFAIGMQSAAYRVSIQGTSGTYFDCCQNDYSSGYETGIHFRLDTYLHSAMHTRNNLYITDNYRFINFSNGDAGFYGKMDWVNSSNTIQAYIDPVGKDAYFNMDIDMNGHSVNNTSDVRLKMNIKNTDVDALKIINSLDLKQFDWVQSGEHVDIGVIAQQLQQVAPELIAESKEGYLSVKTSDFVFYILKAIQQLTDECGLVYPKVAYADDLTVAEKEAFCEKIEDGTKMEIADADKIDIEENGGINQ